MYVNPNDNSFTSANHKKGDKLCFKKGILGTSLVVQWLGLLAHSAGGLDSIKAPLYVNKREKLLEFLKTGKRFECTFHKSRYINDQ